MPNTLTRPAGRALTVGFLVDALGDSYQWAILQGALAKTPVRAQYYFLRGQSTRLETMTDLWRRILSKVFKNAGIQNRAGKFVTLAPKAASDAKPELPMIPYDKRA